MNIIICNATLPLRGIELKSSIEREREPKGHTSMEINVYKYTHQSSGLCWLIMTTALIICLFTLFTNHTQTHVHTPTD